MFEVHVPQGLRVQVPPVAPILLRKKYKMKSQAQKEKAKIAKEKKERPYGSWDPFTQGRYIRDLGDATGQKISTVISSMMRQVTEFEIKW